MRAGPVLLMILLAVLAGGPLAGCADDRPAAGDGTSSRGAGAEAPLPAPAGTPGNAVTGMPNAPGPGQMGPPVADQPETVALDDEATALLAEGVPLDPAVAPLPAMAPPAPTYAIADTEPAAQEAINVVRDYYAAINAQNYAQAYALWSDGGRATNQSPQQFADGFARTNGVSVEVMAPGRVDAAAGSRYIEVPVTLTTTLDDGSQRRHVGMYTLRRTVLDGASPNQRAWRIASAELRVVQP